MEFGLSLDSVWESVRWHGLCDREHTVAKVGIWCIAETETNIVTSLLLRRLSQSLIGNLMKLRYRLKVSISCGRTAICVLWFWKLDTLCILIFVSYTTSSNHSSLKHVILDSVLVFDFCSFCRSSQTIWSRMRSCLQGRRKNSRFKSSQDPDFLFREFNVV